ncbi:MAG TPA: glycosyltransferase [Rhodothermales bacterium]|nr:glycosyltransferase [Rhodothermales bacterium]
MGAITFSIDPDLIQALTKNTSFDLFVETGTYQGETVQRVRSFVPRVISIEQAESYYQAATARFQDDEAITIIHGDSAEALTDLQEQLEGQAILFWLDAHWCVDEQAAGATSQCPLLRELAALGPLHPGSVVLIDDARYFLAPPGQPHIIAQWPTFEEVSQGLRALSADHELIVVNDVLVFHPPDLREVLRSFAHTHGVDWLGMVDRSREHDRMLREMEEKEATIKEIHAAAEERLARIQAFEKEQAQAENLLQARDRALEEQERSIESKDAIIASQQETMATREEVIASLQRELAAQQEIVQGLHDLQVALEGKIAARDELVQSKDEVLAARLEHIHEKEQTIQAREAAQEARADELLAQRAMLATKEAALAAREEQLTEDERALSDREKILRSQEETLAAREEQLASQQADIEAREGETQRREWKMEAQQDRLASLQPMIETLKAAVATHPRAIVTKERELAAKDELLAYKQQEIEQKEQKIQEQHQALIEKEAVIHQLDRFRRSSLRYLFSFRLGGVLRRLWGRALYPIRALFRPRLGTLEQHPPRPLDVPRRYHATRCNVADPPTISVVTPAYNHADYLERTIKSVLGQPYDNLEYIIQDGGSTDGTETILERYQEQCAHVASEPDRGQAHAINLGFAHATGEIMAWLNSDDLLLPGALPYVANYFARHPEVDVVYGHRILIDENDQEIGRWVLPRHDENILNWADYVPQETMFWRRRIWEAAGGQVDESFQFALDWDLLLRFQEVGAKMVCLSRFLGAFRVYAAQKTMDWAEVGEAEMARLRERAHGQLVSWPEINTHVDPYVRRAVHRHLLYRTGLLRL